jgi:hypothetical protein
VNNNAIGAVQFRRRVRADARLRAQASWLGSANVAALPAIAPFGLRLRGRCRRSCAAT